MALVVPRSGVYLHNSEQRKARVFCGGLGCSSSSSVPEDQHNFREWLTAYATAILELVVTFQPHLSSYLWISLVFGRSDKDGWYTAPGLVLCFQSNELILAKTSTLSHWSITFSLLPANFPRQVRSPEAWSQFSTPRRLHTVGAESYTRVPFILSVEAVYTAVQLCLWK